MEPVSPVYQNQNPPVYPNPNVNPNPPVYQNVNPDPPVYPNPNPPVVDPNAPASMADRVAQIVYLVFGVIEALIAIRVILRLLDANPAAGFTSLIYNLSHPFVSPFLGVFPQAQSRGNVLEISSLLAIVVYALIAFIIARFVQIMGRRWTRTPA